MSWENEGKFKLRVLLASNHWALLLPSRSKITGVD